MSNSQMLILVLITSPTELDSSTSTNISEQLCLNNLILPESILNYCSADNKTTCTLAWSTSPDPSDTDIDSLLQSDDVQVSIRLYRPLLAAPNQGGTGPPFPPVPHIIVINAMSPNSSSSDECVAEFNSWYTEEHIPLLQKVPGWIDSKRFSLARFYGNANVPEPPAYLALHAYESMSVFGTEEFRAATSTSWRERVVGGVVKKERYVLKHLSS